MAKVIDSLKNIFRIKELRDRIYITVGILLIDRLGTHLMLPGLDRTAVEAFKGRIGEDAFWNWMQVFSGGGLGNMALLSLGIMPYITSSIIMQLMTKTSKTLEAIAKEGPAGQRRINQYTRLLAIPICLIQAFFALQMIRGQNLVAPDAGFGTYLTIILALSAGGIFVMWLGEQITEFGIGNGASIIIMVGIVARMPSDFIELFHKVRINEASSMDIVFLIALYIAIIIAVVFITQAQRRIPVQHARQWRGRRVTIGQRNYLPMRVNQAGVMPVIFGSALMVIPSLLSRVTGITAIEESFRYGFLFVVCYIGMIYFFSYFWTYLFFQPVEMANNLKEYGSFIPGIRPGQKTAEYLYEIINKITLCGATFLWIIALMPNMVTIAFPNLERALVGFLGGTGILIVVGVGLDLIQKIESYLLMHHYEGFVDGGTIRGRR